MNDDASHNVIADTSSTPVRYQLIYIVHGDANYTYHDSTGKHHLADSEAVVQAQDVAEHSPHSEVFIFHQQSKSFSFFHPFRQTPDGIFYHYRNGMLTDSKRYSRSDDSDFKTEANMVKKNTGHALRIFNYFGHEIPDSEGTGYSQSYPDRNFSLSEFRSGLDRFKTPDLDPEKSFALIMLSTCYGGSPMMMKAVSPYAQFVVASPAYLHLSYFDTRAFKQLPDSGIVSVDTATIHKVAVNIARESFEHLKKNTETEITVAVYDLQRAKFPAIFDSAKIRDTSSTGYHDCAEDSGFDSTAAAAGVDVFYRAPKFGLLKSQTHHSGWECNK